MATGARPAKLTIDGIDQLYYTEVEEEIDSNDKEMHTIPLGHMGFTDGPATRRYRGVSQIPNTGREFNFKRACENHEDHDLGLSLAGDVTETRGRFTSVREMSKTSDTVTINWQFTGKKLR